MNPLVASLKCGAGATWLDVAGAGDHRPANCVNWYVAFAFCVWDGARLPSDLEYNLVMTGGAEQRPFVWGDAALTPERAVYGCLADGMDACSPSDVRRSGRARLWETASGVTRT